MDEYLKRLVTCNGCGRTEQLGATTVLGWQYRRHWLFWWKTYCSDCLYNKKTKIQKHNMWVSVIESQMVSMSPELLPGTVILSGKVLNSGTNHGTFWIREMEIHRMIMADENSNVYQYDVKKAIEMRDKP
jgi:hypothetical protein